MEAHALLTQRWAISLESEIILMNLRVESQRIWDISIMYLTLSDICAFTCFFFFFLPEVMISKDHPKLGEEHPNLDHNLADKSWAEFTCSTATRPPILADFWVSLGYTETIISDCLLQNGRQ